ncbi:MAG: hypothetical protein WC765_08945 [Phycisphaerae bacterium]|jgi:hypothetical protein
MKISKITECIRKSNTYTCLALFLFLSGCANKEVKKQSIKDSDCRENEIVCYFAKSDLQKTMANVPVYENVKAENFSILGQIPQRTDVINDGPRYFLYQDPNTKELWLQKTGGFLGNNIEWRGPIKLDVNDLSTTK